MTLAQKYVDMRSVIEVAPASVSVMTGTEKPQRYRVIYDLIDACLWDGGTLLYSHYDLDEFDAHIKVRYPEAYAAICERSVIEVAPEKRVHG